MFILKIQSDLSKNSKTPAFYRSVDIYEDDAAPVITDGPVYNNISNDTWVFKTKRECLAKIAEYVDLPYFVVIKQRSFIAEYDYDGNPLDGYKLIFDPKIHNTGENDLVEWKAVFRRQDGNDIFYN